MKLRIRLATALLCSAAVIATDRTATAQSQSTSLLRNGATPAPQSASGGGMKGAEMLPAPMYSGGQSQEYYPSSSGEEGYPIGSAEGYCDQGYGAAPSCGEPCGDTGGWCGFCNNGGQFFFTAEYLNVRASFSEATAKVIQDLNAGTDTFVPLDFDFESSYRFGGGYRLCSCGEEIRFMYTRMTSSAFDTAENGNLVPFEAAPPPGGTTFIDANVDAKSYDVEWAKTIPLGGCCSDSCGDACQGGCGNACGQPCCPAWDITWSGGFRWADVDSRRRYDAQDIDEFTVTDARADMNFHGGGLRTGLEGRRYFGKDGWFSVYGKGNLSLLFGRVGVNVLREVDDPSTVTTPDVANYQSFNTRQIIPVTELEAGLTGQVTCHTAISAGYLYAAWHDLGFRDQDQLNTLLPIAYDDANILGFDGFFARIEFAY
jgi:Legionella pneumophila major outer membrane protein precursor